MCAISQEKDCAQYRKTDVKYSAVKAILASIDDQTPAKNVRVLQSGRMTRAICPNIFTVTVKMRIAKDTHQRPSVSELGGASVLEKHLSDSN